MRTERMLSKKPPRTPSSIEDHPEARTFLPLPRIGPIDRCWRVSIEVVRNIALGPVATSPNRPRWLTRSGLSTLDMRP